MKTADVRLWSPLGGTATGLATFAHWESGAILGVLGILGGIGGVQLVGGAVAGKVEDVHTETTAQTQTLATIEKKHHREEHQRPVGRREAGRRRPGRGRRDRQAA